VGNKADVAKSVNGQDISNKELETATKNYKDQYLSLVKGDESLLNLSYSRKSIRCTDCS
jgi:peptidyl-prolyl cis-trans isomerase D